MSKASEYWINATEEALEENEKCGFFTQREIEALAYSLEKVSLGAEIKQHITNLKSLLLDYEAVGLTAKKTPGKWPFDSEAEVKLRRDANRLSVEIMRTEREIITELLK